MGRRNLLDEILQKRRRRPAAATRIDLYRTRSVKLLEAFKQLLKQGDPKATICEAEFTRYFPVALVACIEGYFRMAIADLINKGSPFIDRVIKLRDVNVSIDVAVAIQTSKISLGEYIAHFLSISSLEDICRALSALLDMDFLERLLSSHFHLFEDEPPFQLEGARGDFVAAVRDLFHTRHMLCHEFVPDLSVDNGEMMRAFAATDVLVSVSEIIIWAEECADEVG
jgi:hypothetical protein